mgnify:CR=1 FL=1
MRPYDCLLIAALCVTLPATPARAERTQVYSLRGADCGDCGREALAALKKLKGVKRATWDMNKVEITALVSDGVTDDQVRKTIESASKEFHVLTGPGQGAYLPQPTYPAGTDVVVLTEDGSAVGPLDELRVPGKYTVFDVYADWCGPCRTVDAKLRATVAARPDIAVRKLNLVRFDSPLAREFGASLTALPHVVVFAPDGKRSEFTGSAWPPIARALGIR